MPNRTADASLLTPFSHAPTSVPVSEPASKRRSPITQMFAADVAILTNPKARARPEDEKRRQGSKLRGGGSDQKPIDPLRALARATNDPIKKQLIVLYADLVVLARYGVRQLALEFTEPTGAGPPRDIPWGQLKAMLAIIDRIRALAKDILVLWQPRF